MKKNFFTKALIMGACSVFFVSPFFLHCEEAQASTNGKTASDAITWVRSKLNKGIDFDSFAGNQCVDLIKAYYSYLGQSQPFGNGADYTHNALPAGWRRYTSSQTTPRKGDILIFTGGYGGYGHVAVYESDYSSYHQNWNGHSYVEQIKSKYNATGSIRYWGVIRPDFVAEKSTVTPSSSKTNPVKLPANGFAKVDGVWKFYVNGKIRSNYTGLAPNGNYWWYVKNGVADFSYTGLAVSVNGKWYYVKNGKPDTSYTGFARSTNGNWYFVKNGRYDPSYTGIAYNRSNGGWFFARNGKYDKTYTGLAISTNGRWYYVNKGRLDTSYTGPAKSSNGKWYYCKKGRLDTTFNGRVSYNGKTYNVKNGRVV